MNKANGTEKRLREMEENLKKMEWSHEDVRELIKNLAWLNMKEYQMKMQLMAERKEHEKWLRQHEVRLGEHWKHISKTK